MSSPSSPLPARETAAALAAARPSTTSLGALPSGRAVETVDERLVRAPLAVIFDLARRVEHWPAYLAHYRWVRARERRSDDDMLVEMSANRPFGLVNWPTWWLSEMRVRHATTPATPSIRFRHVGGVTTGMDVEWSFAPEATGTRVRIVHVWDGPRWPLVGLFAASTIIGPVFVHGIAERTLAGLAAVAEAGGKGAGSEE